MPAVAYVAGRVSCVASVVRPEGLIRTHLSLCRRRNRIHLTQGELSERLRTTLVSSGRGRASRCCHRNGPAAATERGRPVELWHVNQPKRMCPSAGVFVVAAAYSFARKPLAFPPLLIRPCWPFHFPLNPPNAQQQIKLSYLRYLPIVRATNR